MVQWMEVARKFFPTHYVEILGSNSVRCRHYKNFILIVSYNRAGTDKGSLILNQLNYDFCVLDEAHFLKNPQAKRTKFIMGNKKVNQHGSFLNRATQVCLMTGTPVLNRPAELYVLLRRFCPELLGKYLDWPFFVRRYCGYQGKGANRTDELGAILSNFMLRRTKEQVLDQLPPIVETVIKIDGIEDCDAAIPLPTRRKNVSLAKFNYIKDYVTDLLETVDKIVLVVYHKETIKKLNEHFKGSVVLQGGLTPEEKNKRIQTFITNEHCNVLIGQINVIGYGIDGLQHISNYIVFGELDWSPGIIEQAKDRLRRIGQAKTVFAYYLIATGTIEEEIDLKLEWKRDVISKLVKESEVIVTTEPVNNLENLEAHLETIATHLGTLVSHFTHNTMAAVEQKVESVLPPRKPKSTGKSSSGNTIETPAPSEAVTTGPSSPDMSLFGETVTTIAEVLQPTATVNTQTGHVGISIDKTALKSQAQKLLSTLKELGVDAQIANNYYLNTVMKDLTSTKIDGLTETDASTLQVRLDKINPVALADELNPKVDNTLFEV